MSVCPVCTSDVITRTETNYKDEIPYNTEYLIEHRYQLNAGYGTCPGSMTVVNEEAAP